MCFGCGHADSLLIDARAWYDDRESERSRPTPPPCRHRRHRFLAQPPECSLSTIHLANSKNLALGFRVIGREGVAMMGRGRLPAPALNKLPGLVSCLSTGQCKVVRLIQRPSKS